MIAMIGAFLGLQGALLTLISAPSGWKRRLDLYSADPEECLHLQLPFGAFLGIAAIGIAVFGRPLCDGT